MASHSLRSRQWSLITYATPAEFQPLLEACAHYAYIFHDKEECIPHYHVICVFKNPRAFAGIKSLIESTQNTLGEVVKKSLSDVYDYLTHDNTDKPLYDKSSVVCDDLAFWDSLVDSEENTTDSLIDDILAGLPLRILARRYGRDFMRNYRSYVDFARMVCEQENGIKKPYERIVDITAFKSVASSNPDEGFVQLSFDDL